MAYRPTEKPKETPPSEGKVVLLAVKGANGGLDFRVSPNIWNVARAADLQYINDLLLEASERARRYPEALFRHLSALSEPPLVTHKVGESGVDDDYLLATCAEFVDLNDLTKAAQFRLSAQDRDRSLTLMASLSRSLVDEQRDPHELPRIEVVNDSLFTMIPFPLHIVDSSGTILFMNKQMEKAVGRRAEGEKCWTVYREDQQQCSDCPLRESIEIGKTDSMEVSGGVGGRVYEIHHTGVTYRGEPALLEIFLDVTDRKRAEEQQKLSEAAIWRQANYDSLTGLPNRSLFHDRLEHEIRNLRSDQESLALFFLDLDNFKGINDSLGHRRGDLLLVETAKRINGCVRAGDTVARLAGDEFTIIVPALINKLHIERIAQAIRTAFSRPFLLDGYTARITTSIGIALYPSDATNPEDLISYADQAMYRAKGLGGDRHAYGATVSPLAAVSRPSARLRPSAISAKKTPTTRRAKDAVPWQKQKSV